MNPFLLKSHFSPSASYRPKNNEKFEKVFFTWSNFLSWLQEKESLFKSDCNFFHKTGNQHWSSTIPVVSESAPDSSSPSKETTPAPETLTEPGLGEPIAMDGM
ncbi:unnamed protein product, partial [Meganyctiphanes norvegica]